MNYKQSEHISLQQTSSFSFELAFENTRSAGICSYALAAATP
jgi:hypothetical protein